MHVELCEGLTQIGKRAFWQCRLLESITIQTKRNDWERSLCPMWKIGERWACGGPREDNGRSIFGLQVPKVYPPTIHRQNICYSVFEKYENLVEIELCEGLKKMGEFGGCTSLQRIKVPSTVEKLRCHVFSGCTWLVQEEVELQEGLEQIDYYWILQLTRAHLHTLHHLGYWMTDVS